jgi:hypothetical protein
MEEGRLPKEVMKWRPPGRTKRGRPNSPGRKGLRTDGWKGVGGGGMERKTQLEEEDNIINKWAHELVNTLYNLLNNYNNYPHTYDQLNNYNNYSHTYNQASRLVASPHVSRLKFSTYLCMKQLAQTHVKNRNQIHVTTVPFGGWLARTIHRLYTPHRLSCVTCIRSQAKSVLLAVGVRRTKWWPNPTTVLSDPFAIRTVKQTHKAPADRRQGFPLKSRS